MTMSDILSSSEHIPWGKRVDTFAFDVHISSGWVSYSEEKAIGAKRLIRNSAVTADVIRNFPQCAAVPIIESVDVC